MMNILILTMLYTIHELNAEHHPHVITENKIGFTTKYQYNHYFNFQFQQNSASSSIVNQEFFKPHVFCGKLNAIHCRITKCKLIFLEVMILIKSCPHTINQTTGNL